MLTPTHTPKRRRGNRSSIERDVWELALWGYHFSNRTLREIGKDLDRDHTSVLRKFQRMQIAEPKIVQRLRRQYGKGTVAA